jgi:hypothetical protein
MAKLRRWIDEYDLVDQPQPHKASSDVLISTPHLVPRIWRKHDDPLC